MLNFINSIYLRIFNYLTSPQVALFLGEPFFRLRGLRKRERLTSLSDLRHILVVRLDEIGDVVMTTPFLRELRKNAKNAWITLVVKPEVFNLVELCPHVNEVLVYDWNTHGRYQQLIRHWRAINLASKHLWDKKFDLSIVPRWDRDYYNASFVSYFSGAVNRIGYSEIINEEKKIYNKNFDLLFNHVLNDNNQRHEAVYSLNIIKRLNGTIKEDHLEAWLSTEDESYAKELLKRYDRNYAGDFSFIAIAPGSRSQRKQWPIDNYIAIARWLIDHYGSIVILLGGSDEKSIGKQFEDNIQDNLINLIGQTSLRQTAAVMKECQLFVGNDGGPMHLAAAVGTSIIGIFCHPKSGSTKHYNSPQRFGPWKVRSTILQPEFTVAPCKDSCLSAETHCIKNISTVEVIKSILKQLSDNHL